MNFPAARASDPITHDSIVPSGTIGPSSHAATLIERAPAATMGDSVLCSGTTSAGPAHPPPPVPPLIVAGSATVLIGGQPAARWAPGPDFATCGALLGDVKLAAGRTVFIGGKSSLVVAIETLRLLLAKKRAALTRWDAGARTTFERWFGTAADEARARIARRIERMDSLLDRYGESSFRGAGEHDTEALYAFVHPKDDSVVYLGSLFARSPMSGPDSQASTLGHELSHFRSVDGTADHVYGRPKCLGLARSEPSKALGNADNFNYYLDE